MTDPDHKRRSVGCVPSLLAFEDRADMSCRMVFRQAYEGFETQHRKTRLK